MRIVGGALSGRRFKGPPGNATRPTSERVREAIASVLFSRGAIEGAAVLDLYAGTGALAFEALSRGAERAVLVERSKRVASALSRSARELGLSRRVEIICADVSPELIMRHGQHDLVFVDPPYADIEKAHRALESTSSVVRSDGYVVLEHATRQPPPAFTKFVIAQRYRYGDTGVVLLQPAPPEPSDDPLTEAHEERP